MSEKKEKVCVVGLGYVGLTLATVLAEVGFEVIGVEKRQDVVDKVNAGIPHFSEKGLQEGLARVTSSGKLKAVSKLDSTVTCGVYIITVGTPLNTDTGLPRVDMIEEASRQVAENMPEGAMVILRSTVKVGTTRNVVAPILRKTGKKFDIAMCPERTLEGKALRELRELPQIVGADEQSVRDRAAELFKNLTNSIVQVSSLEAAEIVKLVDNTFRDVQFAFANEVARLCEAFGVNSHEIITSGKLGYERTNVPLPGLVGGPCLEKDPHILIDSMRSRGLDLDITKASRKVNERQPIETMEFIAQEMENRDMGQGVTVALLGMAFKGVPATDDLRGSMSLKVLAALKNARPDVKVRAFDPVISKEDLEQQIEGIEACASLSDAVGGASVVIIGNNHPFLGEHTPAYLYELMDRDGFIYDYWNHFSKLSAHEIGQSYYAVGNTRKGI